MKNICIKFRYEVTDLFKAYRMSHFSLHNMHNTYYKFRDDNPQLRVFTIRIPQLNDEVDYTEIEIDKNLDGGLHQRVIAGNTIAMFYNIWEDKYRKLIADKLKCSKNEIKSDFFKELNYIRQSITHNNYKPINNLDKLEKLNFVGNSIELKLTIVEVQKIYELLLVEVEELRKEVI